MLRKVGMKRFTGWPDCVMSFVTKNLTAVLISAFIPPPHPRLLSWLAPISSTLCRILDPTVWVILLHCELTALTSWPTPRFCPMLPP